MAETSSPHQGAARAEPSSLLAPFHGRRPPAPAWFDRAVATAPERSTFAYDGVDIELLTWGEAGRPGLLFLHGDSAHADWWSFIAPFFAQEWRCAAISWSGMGGSGWRDSYRLKTYAQEALAAIAPAGLDPRGEGVTLVAHSMGGYPAMIAAGQSTQVRGVVLVDSAIMPPHLAEALPSPRSRPHRFYESVADALARFRLMPEQPVENAYIVDHIARLSLRPKRQDGRDGWVWRFDPDIWRDLDRADLSIIAQAAHRPLALLWGGDSVLMRPETVDYMRTLFAPGTPMAEIPQAGHHVMVDQPLALVSAIRALLQAWPQPG